MNAKTAKKIRKETRKVAREEFGTGIKMLNKLMRKRPKFVPKFIWVLIYLPLFRFKHIKLIYQFI